MSTPRSLFGRCILRTLALFATFVLVLGPSAEAFAASGAGEAHPGATPPSSTADLLNAAAGKGGAPLTPAPAPRHDHGSDADHCAHPHGFVAPGPIPPLFGTEAAVNQTAEFASRSLLGIPFPSPPPRA